MANIVAIVGRPNVGKSTLFNRLIAQKSAITEDIEGTTRDRHYGYAEWTGKRFTVIDTGGYVHFSDDPFEKAIRHQVQIALEEASVILFVVDCKTGLTGLDGDFARLLRTSKKPVLIVANKADNVQRDLMSHEFHQLGMGEIYPIAAISGTGTGELLDAVTHHLTDAEEEESEQETPKFAIVGRPNVGKSSFINALVGEDRSIVSSVAGTTRDATHTHYDLFGKNFLLVDTAGIRKKAKVTENIEFFSVIRAIRALQNSDVCFVLIDATQGLEGQDINILGLAQRYKKGMVILVNKWDLIEKDANTINAYKEKLLAKLAPLTYIPILFISALNKKRILQAVDKGLEVYKNRKSKFTTSKLNNTMLPLIAAYPPPAVKGKHIKIKYITQLPTHTPVFAFFCNLPQYIKPTYKSYLENQLRKHFNLEGVPIKLVFRSK